MDSDMRLYKRQTEYWQDDYVIHASKKELQELRGILEKVAAIQGCRVFTIKCKPSFLSDWLLALKLVK